MSAIKIERHKIGQESWRSEWMEAGRYKDDELSTKDEIVYKVLEEDILIKRLYRTGSDGNWYRTSETIIPENPVTWSQWKAQIKANKVATRRQTWWYRVFARPLVWLGILPAPLPVAKALP